tara:strand:+ start:135 stop:539 length:405 start_codon:yes stop_codon:yes gene_type:complete
MAFKMKNPSVMKMAKEAGSSMKMKKAEPMKMAKDPMKMKEPMKMKKPMKLKKDSPMDLNKGFDRLPEEVQDKILKKDSAKKMKKAAMKLKEKSAMKLKSKDKKSYTKTGHDKKTGKLLSDTEIRKRRAQNLYKK